VTPQTGVELILAMGAAGLLARDVRRAWRDRLRRPVTLLAAGLMAAPLMDRAPIHAACGGLRPS
jgi:hypothetical protein